MHILVKVMGKQRAPVGYLSHTCKLSRVVSYRRRYHRFNLICLAVQQFSQFLFHLVRLYLNGEAPENLWRFG
jgi:hypothetical protein